MNENKHTPDIKCYRINYSSEYWANVAAKVGNQCSSPVGAVFAVNALCDAYEDIAKQLAEAKKDAERYRWLRDTLTSAVGGGVQVNDAALVYEESEPGEAVQVYWYPDTPVGFYESKADSLDEAIDAAIRKLGEQE